MSTQTTIWQHRTSGEQYVVGLDAEGRVVAAQGPIARLEAHELLAVGFPGLDSDPDLVEDLCADQASYALAFDD